MHAPAWSALLLSARHAAAVAAVDIAADCTGQRSGIDVRACLTTQSVAADRGLERIEGRMRSRIALWEQPATHVQRAMAAFDADRAAYRRYRDAQCEFQTTAAADDDAAVRSACRISMDRERVELLSGRIGWFDPGD